MCTPFFIEWMKTGFNKCTTVDKHLVWPYAKRMENNLSQDLYNLILILGIGSLNTEWYGLFYVVTSVLSLKYIQHVYEHSWGSVWCNFVNFLAIGALLI